MDLQENEMKIKNYQGELTFNENNEASGVLLSKKYKINISTDSTESIEIFAIQLDKNNIGIPYTGIITLDFIEDLKKKLNVIDIDILYGIIVDCIDNSGYNIIIVEKLGIMKIQIKYDLKLGKISLPINFVIELKKLENNQNFKIVMQIMLYFKQLYDESEIRLQNLEKNINFVNSKFLSDSTKIQGEITPDKNEKTESNKLWFLDEKFTLLNESISLLDILITIKKQIGHLEIDSDENVRIFLRLK